MTSRTVAYSQPHDSVDDCSSALHYIWCCPDTIGMPSSIVGFGPVKVLASLGGSDHQFWNLIRSLFSPHRLIDKKANRNDKREKEIERQFLKEHHKLDISLWSWYTPLHARWTVGHTIMPFYISYNSSHIIIYFACTNSIYICIL